LKLRINVKSTTVMKGLAEVVLGGIILLSFLSLVPNFMAAKEEDRSTDPAYLTAEIEKVQERIAQSDFPTAKEAEDTVDLIIQWSKDFNIQIWSVSKVEGKEGLVAGRYPAIQHAIDMRGTPEDTIRFIEWLNSGPLDTAVIDNVDIRAEETLWFSRIQLKVYTKA